MLHCCPQIRVPLLAERRNLFTSPNARITPNGSINSAIALRLAIIILAVVPAAAFIPCVPEVRLPVSRLGRHRIVCQVPATSVGERIPVVGAREESEVPVSNVVAAAASLAVGAGSVAALLVGAIAAASNPKGGTLQEELGVRGVDIASAIGQMSPTYVKFGQALAQRPDLVGAALARSLSALQDRMEPFDTVSAHDIIARELAGREGSEEVLNTLSANPVAAASIGQVYRARLKGSDVAVKVRRPGVVERIHADAAILRSAAFGVEALPAPGGGRLIRARAVDAVDEFVSRLLEEADFENEARNLAKFAALYGKNGTARLPAPGVICPTVVPNLCTSNVLVMSWVEGERLVPVGADALPSSDLPLLRLGIACTLSQLLDTGVMHADPHGGNLLKTSTGRLAYLDFGLVSEVPLQVREGLVCAVAYLVAKDFDAMASLFGELMLLPQRVLDDKAEAAAFKLALRSAAEEILDYGRGEDDVPVLRFDRLIGALGKIAPRFEFTLPPYFLNNARAIGTLEGMAKSADPGFNVLSEVYGFSVKLLLAGDKNSKRLSATLRDLTHDSRTNEPDMRKVWRLVKDASRLAGVSKRRVVLDALKGARGRSLAASVARSFTTRRIRAVYRPPLNLGKRVLKKVLCRALWS